MQLILPRIELERDEMGTPPVAVENVKHEYENMETSGAYKENQNKQNRTST
jgi:hypothetical protein